MSLLETLSGAAVRHLSQNKIDTLRGFYLSLRGKMFPLMKLVYGTFDTNDLRKHLEEQLDDDFEILMVHSSVNHMIPMYMDSPLDLVRMLMSFCGPNRTLVMPAFYFGDPEVGDVIKTFRQTPRFDIRRTPSQMGLATELFRRTPGVIQSRHPIYRVSALGPLAKQLTAGHENCDFPSGTGSPFDFMTKHKTLILGIGKTFQVLTQIHHAEDIMGADFPVPRGSGSALSITVIDGKEEVQASLNGCGLLWDADIWKLRNIMDKVSLQEWSFHHVPFFATIAGDVTSALVNAAKNGITLYEKP
jgi:aminoglycoside 3-N-acetyltransferase